MFNERQKKQGGNTMTKMEIINDIMANLVFTLNGEQLEIVKSTFIVKMQGYDVKYIKKCIALRKKDKDEVEEEDELMKLYRSALGL